MFSTVNTKVEQLRNGFTRSGTGQKKVLIIGSCRSVSYMNFFSDINDNNALSIYFIDPFYWNWDIHDNRVDLHENLKRCETHNGILDLIRTTDWFIHEHYENFDMFNTDSRCEKKIYDFGMNAKVDFTIPNYSNKFVLFQDIVDFNHELRPLARRDLAENGNLSSDLQQAIANSGRADIAKFISVCNLSSFPEFGKSFGENWTKTRFFWNLNHVTSRFTTGIFELISHRLGLAMTPKLKAKWNAEDPFASHFTKPTQYDVDNYGLRWPEQIAQIKTPPE